MKLDIECSEKDFAVKGADWPEFGPDNLNHLVHFDANDNSENGDEGLKRLIKHHNGTRSQITNGLGHGHGSYLFCKTGEHEYEKNRRIEVTDRLAVIEDY